MRVQYNKQTKMTWAYLPTAIVRLLGLKPKDDVEYIQDEKTKKVEFRKVVKIEDKK